MFAVAHCLSLWLLHPSPSLPGNKPSWCWEFGVRMYPVHQLWWECLPLLTQRSFWPLRGSCMHMIHIHTLKVYVYTLNKNEYIFKNKAKFSCIWPNVVSEWASMLKNFCLICFYQKDLGCCWGASSKIWHYLMSQEVAERKDRWCSQEFLLHLKWHLIIRLWHLNWCLITRLWLLKWHLITRLWYSASLGLQRTFPEHFSCYHEMDSLLIWGSHSSDNNPELDLASV